MPKKAPKPALTKKTLKAMASNVLVIRTSERSLFTQCRQAWWWAYVERLRYDVPQVPLEFGTLIHEALRIYYKPGLIRGPHPAKTFKRLYAQWVEEHDGEELYLRTTDDDDDPDRVTAGDLGDEMLCNYINEYGEDKNIEVLVPEQLFQVEVYDDDEELVCIYVGQIDAVIRDIKTGRVGFMEHKTGASLEPFGAPVPLDEQTGSYWTFAPTYLKEMGLLDPDEEVEFVLFNRLRKAFADQREKDAEGYALNKNGTRSKRQPQPLFKRELIRKSDFNRQILFDRVVAQANEMKMIKNGELQVYKEPGRHCTWCPFYKSGMCEVHECGSDWESIRDTSFKVWEPYEEHEILAEGRR